jgi:hypothetical protein
MLSISQPFACRLLCLTVILITTLSSTIATSDVDLGGGDARLNAWSGESLFGIVDEVDVHGVMHGKFASRDGRTIKSAIKQFKMQADGTDISSVVKGYNVSCFPLLDSDNYTVAACNLDDKAILATPRYLPYVLKDRELSLSRECNAEEIRAQRKGRLIKEVSCN